MSKILKIAHRGASGHAPENTLAAFRKAIELDADMVELDVHLCKTGELIVMHDETVDRTTNGRGKISHLTLDQIKQLTIKGKEKIPTLQEVIDITKGECGLDIEIKNKKTARKVLEVIKNSNFQDPLIISSNYLKPLRIISHSGKSIDTALIFRATKTPFMQTLLGFFCLLILPLVEVIILRRAWQAKVRWIHLMYPLAYKNYIKLLQKLNYKVAVWTINSPKRIRKMKKMGVDGIISNYPDRL